MADVIYFIKSYVMSAKRMSLLQVYLLIVALSENPSLADSVHWNLLHVPELTYCC